MQTLRVCVRPAGPREKKKTMETITLHTRIKSISRSKGKTATNSAAYRAGTKLHDERTGITHDYTRKGGVVCSKLVFPEGEKALTSEELWNLAERTETRRNACTAREWELSIPHELTVEKQRELVQKLADFVVKKYGFALEFSIHRPTKKTQDPRNVHVHFLATTRAFKGGQLTQKTRILDAIQTRGAEIREWRELWCQWCNTELEKAGAERRFTPASFRERGIDRTPQVHAGPAVTAMERKGKETVIGTKNTEIKLVNECINIAEILLPDKKKFDEFVESIDNVTNPIKLEQKKQGLLKLKIDFEKKIQQNKDEKQKTQKVAEKQTQQNPVQITATEKNIEEKQQQQKLQRKRMKM